MRRSNHLDEQTFIGIVVHDASEVMLCKTTSVLPHMST